MKPFYEVVLEDNQPDDDLPFIYISEGDKFSEHVIVSKEFLKEYIAYHIIYCYYKGSLTRYSSKELDLFGALYDAIHV